MPTPLSTYLHDHMAGAVAALDLLGHLVAADAGTDRGLFFTALKADVQADQAELKALIARLGVTRSPVRRAVGWAAARAARLKLAVSDPAGGPLRLLEAVEALAVGIHGKGCLWRALAAAAEANPALSGLDYEQLEGRAAEQRQRVERVRLEAARAALGG